MSTSPVLSRRGLLRLGAAIGVAAAAGPALTACGSSTTQAKAHGLEVTLPTYQAISSTLKPDLPGTAAGVPQGFFTYPKQLFRAVQKPPLSGQTLSIAEMSFLPPPPAREKNAAWRAIEERLGGKIDWTVVAADDWPTKFSTMVAGDALPDMFVYQGGVDNLPAFAKAKCADLSPYLSGDKARDYPNLANIPDAIWKQCLIGGKLYGLPIPRSITGGDGFYRADLFARAGVTSLDQIADADAFFELMKEVTRPKDGVYGIMTGFTNIAVKMFGAPYYWQVDHATGKFTADVETEEYRAAIEYVARLNKAGVYYPGSAGMQKAKYINLFQAGKAAYVYDGLPGYLGPTGHLATMKKIDPTFDVRPFMAPGRTAVSWPDNVMFAMTLIKQAGEEKVKQALGVANWAASPFGSEEYTLIAYGVEGVDYQRDDKDNPVLNDTGTQDTAVPWKYIAAPPQALFDSGSAQGVRYVHEALSKQIGRVIEDPTVGLYSPTWESSNGTLLTLRTDTVNDILAGRKPMSAFDDMVKQYRSKGADKARSEFESAWAQSQKGSAK
ncbi:extracellular solute-binding protein [Streptacidiphilus griseoplanus]|uniref:extracellular solute-binding protein n=1 Tax=Peterkaempfera griseoplana TaxID=66896 RepID=UPI0006E30AD1|nr:extracellular solute-binding protein [Peterkaempfera griseoplana]